MCSFQKVIPRYENNKKILFLISLLELWPLDHIEKGWILMFIFQNELTNEKELSLTLTAPKCFPRLLTICSVKRLICLCIKDLSTELIKHIAENIFVAITRLRITACEKFDEHQEANVPSSYSDSGCVGTVKVEENRTEEQTKTVGELFFRALYFN